jgi:uncharacterized protein (TIGR02145 family)
MKSTWGWHNKGNGTNSSGFSGFPGGTRANNGAFYHVGEYGYWWSATENLTGNAWDRSLNYGSDDVSKYNDSKGRGLSVRCLMDY